ncbi:lipase family protein [Pseudalkalibacillus sp. Hm43]|uniref:lipase family protein n=1 Tax=Pseudalkalibacillus sp. Hm43 TaxID=3450742 RepID=UPI003F425512
MILDSSHAVVTAFRGTRSTPDWLVDADIEKKPFHGGYVHDGFYSVYRSCQDSLLNAYMGLAQKENKTLYITGHSLGAALATLHALDVANNRKGIHFKNIIMYNYASPLVGDHRFASIYNAIVPNSIRIVNTHDVVPMIPYPRWGYEHVHTGVSFTLPDMQDMQKDRSYNHSLKAYHRGITHYL